MTEKYYRSGQYELTRTIIRTNSDTPVEIDFGPSFIDIVVYESIFDQTMSGAVTLVDSFNLIQQHGLGNGETIELEWSTSGTPDGKIKVEGVVYQLVGPIKVNDHAAGYTLNFASPELVESERQRVYSGHNDTCSSIANKLIKQISKRKYAKRITEVHTTRNIEHIVFTGDHPLDAIAMVAKRSISSQGELGYLMYENNRELCFKPLHLLYKQEPVVKYSYQSQPAFDNVKSAHEESFNTFQSFEIAPNNKLLDDIQDGQLGSRHDYFSLAERSSRQYSYDAKAKHKKAASLGKSALLVGKVLNNKYTDRVTVSYNLDKEAHEQYVQENLLQILKAHSYVVTIGVFGNSLIKVGDICEAYIPSYASSDFTEENTDVISGKFLIAEIKHLLTNKQYTQSIKLVKDAFEESLA